MRIIYQNDGKGNIHILPVTEADMPKGIPGLDHGAWDKFYQDLTAQYGTPSRVDNGEFIGSAQHVKVYQSVDNVWVVFGLDVRPGLDNHTIRLVRFALRDSLTGVCWLTAPGPPVCISPEVARDWIKSWAELDALPTV